MSDNNSWLGTAEGIAASVGTKALAGAIAGSALPGIGTALGGLGGIASALVPYVFSSATKPALAAAAQSITGAVDEAAQVAQLNADPTAMAQFRDSALQIAEQEIEARLSDTQDARTLQEKLVMDHSVLAYWPCAIDAFVLVLFGGALFWVLKYGAPVDPVSHDLVVGSIGILGTLSVQIVQYWRGSSRGSATARGALQSIALRN